MTPAYVTQHFSLQEFLPKEIYEALAQSDSLWRGWLLMDERILRTADSLRESFGALTINNWHSGGERNESGLRVPGMKNYKSYSQHSYGRAVDCVSKSLSGDDMRRYILANPEKFPYITRMERDVSWLHVDCGNAPRIALVNA